MALAFGNLAFVEKRCEGREDVQYRARAFGPEGQPLKLTIVNVSPHGLMARCETPFDAGQRIRLILPVVGTRIAEVRWCLGGRLGCQFESAVDLASYYELPADLVRQSRHF